MKENNRIVCFRSFIAGCMMFVVFAASSTVALAMQDSKSTSGELIVSGYDAGGNAPFALLNGERAFSGRTFFSSSTVATTEASSATVKLNQLGSINLSPNSILSLNFGNNKISGNLIAGQIKVFSNKGVEVNIQAANRVVAGDVSQSNVFTIDVQTGATNAMAEVGAIQLNGETISPTGAQQSGGNTTASSGGNSYFIPLIIFGGIVATAAIYAVTNNDNDNTFVASPTR